MSRRYRLIPLLVAVLVAQGLVSVLPHAHHSTVDGRAWRANSSFDPTHHCLACSVQAPVVEPAAEFDDSPWSATTAPVEAECGSSGSFSTLESVDPRGPPRVV